MLKVGIGASSRRNMRLSLAAGVGMAALLAGLASARAQDSVMLHEISVAAAQPTANTRGVVATRSTAEMLGNGLILEVPATVSVVTRSRVTRWSSAACRRSRTSSPIRPGYVSEDSGGGQGAPAFTLRGFFRTINYDNVYEDGLRYDFNTYDQLIEPYGFERVDAIKGPQASRSRRLTCPMRISGFPAPSSKPERRPRPGTSSKASIPSRTA